MEKNNKKATQEFSRNFLQRVERRLINPKNKAPAATFTKRQRKLKDMLDQL
tara:strand:- start:750 stop:902 length:153 start_codon:yes stop_codon:yes gene_type:complete